mgnify:FL=1
MSYIQINHEVVYDLLRLERYTTPQLKLRERPVGGVYVQGVTSRRVTSSEEVAAALQEGGNNFTLHTTHMGQNSTRAHSLFTITLAM